MLCNLIPKMEGAGSFQAVNRHLYKLLEKEFPSLTIKTTDEYCKDSFNILQDGQFGIRGKFPRAELMWFDEFTVPTPRVKYTYGKTEVDYDTIWCCTEWSKHILEKWREDLADITEKIVIRPLDPSLFSYNVPFKHKKYDFIFIGSDEPAGRKGINFLNEVILKYERPTVVLTRSRYLKRPWVYDFGAFKLSDEDRNKLIAQSKFLLSPTSSEGVGMPVLEAMALGTIPIYTEIPSYREFAEGIPIEVGGELETYGIGLKWIRFDVNGKSFIDACDKALSLNGEEYLLLQKKCRERAKLLYSSVVSSLVELFNEKSLQPESRTRKIVSILSRNYFPGATLYYLMPADKTMSFSLIGEEHIKELKKYVPKNYKIKSVSDAKFNNFCETIEQNSLVLLHPIGYTFLKDFDGQYRNTVQGLNLLKSKGCKIGGFDVADSDEICSRFVDILNKMDVIFVPSSWNEEVYRKCGVIAPVSVLPHGLDSEFLKETKEIKDEVILKLQKDKIEKNYVYVLFFLLHSGIRKGADLVKDIMIEIQKKHSNVFLIIKTKDKNVLGEINNVFKGIRKIVISEWLSAEKMRELYDISDILLSPSRGGGFEINALEGISRGCITLVPNAGSFTDYMEYAVPIKVKSKRVKFWDNKIHNGKGFEIEVDDAVEKLDAILKEDNYVFDLWKKKAEMNAVLVRKTWTWVNTGKILTRKLKEIGWI